MQVKTINKEEFLDRTDKFDNQMLKEELDEKSTLNIYRTYQKGD